MQGQWQVFGGTEQGPRSRNEDYHVADEGAGIFVVADGMGKHAGGDIASRMGSQTALRTLRDLDPHFAMLARLDSPATRAAAQSAMSKAIGEACRVIYEAAKSDPGLRDMGTTLDAVVIRGKLAVIGHVGDGRTYLMRDRQLYQLTEDHSLVAAQLKAGTITPEEAKTSPFKNVLVKSLGQQPSVEVDTAVLECVPGDVLMVCSDGLHAPVGDSRIAAMLSGKVDELLPQALLKSALENGTRDNSTCIIMTIPAAKPTDEDTLTVGKVDALKKVPLFDEFDYREKQAVLAIASFETKNPGEVIFNAGDPSTDMYVVVRGKAVVESMGVHLSTLEAGSHFGEMGIVEDVPRSATVRTTERTALLKISRTELYALMKRSPEIGHKFSWALVHALSQRLRASSESYAMTKSSTGYRLPTSR